MASKRSKVQVLPIVQPDVDISSSKDLVAQLLDLSLENKQLSALAKPFVMAPKLNRKSIVGEFARYFGSEDRLENWQRLCLDVGIEDTGTWTSITQCRLVLRRVWVNIYDLIVAVRQNTTPKIFKSQHALRCYTIDTGKIFPKKKAKDGGPVKALLAHIFS